MLVGAQRLLDYKSLIQSDLPSYQTEEQDAEGDKPNAAHLKQYKNYNLSKTAEIGGRREYAQTSDGNCTG